MQLAAPAANTIIDSTDFYDRTAAFTWSVNVGALFKVADNVALNAQPGLRHVGGLSQVDQLVGSGLDDINNDTARLTFPIVIGVRFGFRNGTRLRTPGGATSARWYDADVSRSAACVSADTCRPEIAARRRGDSIR